MPIRKFYCAACDAIFDVLFDASTPNAFFCSRCKSSDLWRVSPDKRYNDSQATPLFEEVRAGGSCPPGSS